MKSKSSLLWLVGLLLECSWALAPVCASEFAEVAEIFSKHCLRCHNDVARQGDFSLQSHRSLEASGVVQPGDSSSYLLSVINADGDQPPSMPKESKPLSTKQVDVIRRWIQSGAAWPPGETISEAEIDFDWWSFRPIADITATAIDSPWVRTPIDALALRKMNELGLVPSDDADRTTLIRRLTYDLTGLPPSPEAVDRFTTDSDPRAYENLVDQLLESKHYGERWARHWLDVVKYADTCGYDKDKLRPHAWPYRDYVIRSLNEDKPYGRFVQEQIAGDVLFPNDPDGILGLGFIAAGPWDFIGHVEVSEQKLDGKVARNLDRDEMVSNTLNTFCSVTIQCARCHNHKFDPFTQEDYYSLQAIFAAVDRADRIYESDPQIENQRVALQAQLVEHQQARAELEFELTAAGGDRLLTLDRQITELSKSADLRKDAEFGFHSELADQFGSEKWVQIELERNVDAAQIVLHPCHDDFGSIGAGFGFPIRYKVQVRQQEASDWTDLFVADRDIPNPGLAAVVIEAHNRSIRFVRVTAINLASRVDSYMFALAELRVLDAAGNNVAHGATVTSLDSIEAPPRWGRQNLVDGKWPRPRDRDSYRQLQDSQAQRAQLVAAVETPERIARRRQINTDIKKTQQELDALPNGKLVYAAATKFAAQSNFKPTDGQPRPIHLLHRGNVDQPGQVIGPGLLPTSKQGNWKLPEDTSDSQRRAALATWLTDKQNPLVWRSIVNRIWQHHFGEGLVDTPNDFGRMGGLPSNPDLLDFLATRFRDGDQSLKQLHRLIVTSSLYRQSSQFNEANAAIDSDNRYLWRFNRRRLSAEEIRDAVLSVSGALNPKMGGPGYYLFELEKTEHSPHFEYHKFDPTDPASHRRSIYRFIARSQPNPYMTTLDCADSSQSTPRRIETLTSLQALSLLNNRFNLEMARRFALRLSTETSDSDTQVDRAMKLLCGRSPTEHERQQMSSYLDRHGLPNLCRMLFNLSEFVYLD